MSLLFSICKKGELIISRFEILVLLFLLIFMYLHFLENSLHDCLVPQYLDYISEYILHMLKSVPHISFLLLIYYFRNKLDERISYLSSDSSGCILIYKLYILIHSHLNVM